MIIGLLGFAGSGKGTVADILVSKGFKKESFADPVKDAVTAIFGWERSLLEGDTDESRKFRETRDEFWSSRFHYEVTPRFMLQLMGTEVGRDVFDHNLWIHCIEKKVAKNEKTVIADVRFSNECEFIRSQGGILIRVVRGPEPVWYNEAELANSSHNNYTVMVDYPDVHYSEWAWIGQKTHHVIDNNGSFTDLQNNVNNLLQILT